MFGQYNGGGFVVDMPLTLNGMLEEVPQCAILDSAVYAIVQLTFPG